MGHRIIFATGNEGKMREIRVLLADLGLPVLSMKEAGVNPEIVEDGADFGENAEIKARAVWNLSLIHIFNQSETEPICQNQYVGFIFQKIMESKGH